MTAVPTDLPPKPPRHYPTPAAKCADLVVRKGADHAITAMSVR